MPLIQQFRYRPEIDGLRAVAVLAVVLFHAGFGCPGGYIGVDVFFVISGFLITSLIWKDLESGRFTFVGFWEKRARRIVPALAVMTLATLVAGWFLLLPADFKGLGRAAAAQSLFAANLHYWRDSGYFSGIADEKPLLHTWSLAVEEQFYLIVPFLLWAMFRSPLLRKRASVLGVLSVGFVLSFAASLYGVAHFTSAAFYFLPTRAWELLLGSLIAFLPWPAILAGRGSLREACSAAGLALMLAPVFLYTPETPFPGLAAVPPCLGAGLLIWANGAGRTVVGSVLSARPVVFVGLISYSLYLWHWPFFAFSKYLALAPLAPGRRAVLLGLGLACAVLSWKYVETPFRTRRLGASRRSMFAFAGTGLAMVLACGLMCEFAKGFPRRLPAQAVKFAEAGADMAFINELNAEDVRAGKLIPIGASRPGLRPTVLVWGDSHAMAAMPAIDALLKQKGMAGRAATHSDTAPVLNWFFPSVYGLDRNSIAFNQGVLSYIQSRKIQHVLLIGRWGQYTRKKGRNTKPLPPAVLAATVRRLAAVGVRSWVMLEVPAQAVGVPRVLSRSVISGGDTAWLCAKPKKSGAEEASDVRIAAQVKAAGGQVLDPKPVFLDPTKQRYIMQLKGVALYRDEQHLTTKGAKLTLLPFLHGSSVFKD